ncbi:MAG: SpoIIE family protein phosphatase, partial [bacterium]|nr:SpoIIE family protein phosphatase [bacterium]
FDQNDDVDRIIVVSYEGEIVYDSDVDTDKKYEGEARIVEEKELLDSVQSENVSLKTLDGDTAFLKIGLDSNVSVVDKNEKSVLTEVAGKLLDYFVVPANEKYSIIYSLDYHNMDFRVAIMQRRIIYLGLFGIMLGMILSFLMASQVTKPVAQLVAGVGEIAKGNFDTSVNIKTHDELRFLGEAFNKMAVDLKASVEAKLYQERVVRELELATQIQNQLIPKVIPQIEGIDIAAQIIPAGEIGGDIYDFLPVDDKRLMMYLGDVTGHGVPAGIVSSIANSLFYGYRTSHDLGSMMVGVNSVLKAKTMPTMFMTLCLMDWNVETQKFTYTSAGHEQIVHYRAKTDDVILEPAAGIALGMLPDFTQHVNLIEVDFQVGDYLVVYSDGIPEAWKNDTDCYGMERFQAQAKVFGKLEKAEQIKDAILKDVLDFQGDHEQMDDITLLVIKKV